MTIIWIESPEDAFEVLSTNQVVATCSVNLQHTVTHVLHILVPCHAWHTHLWAFEHTPPSSKRTSLRGWGLPAAFHRTTRVRHFRVGVGWGRSRTWPEGHEQRQTSSTIWDRDWETASGSEFDGGEEMERWPIVTEEYKRWRVFLDWGGTRTWMAWVGKKLLPPADRERWATLRHISDLGGGVVCMG
jgi:hypothetical protein